MEERIIDDEYSRGIRLKKTKDGYVDVTDELSEGAKETPPETEEDSVLEGELTESLEDPEAEPEEEVSFEFPELEEDDEDPRQSDARGSDCAPQEKGSGGSGPQGGI